jgi:hypothetical protein
MSIALRRKMFKLGGSTNTHGMGLTSGLKMKKGGSVQASIGAGSGNQPMKMGPDGQMREGHVLPILPLLGTGLATAGRFGLKALAPGARSLISALRSPGGIRSLINRPVMKDAVKGKGFVMGTPTAPGIGLKALRGTGLGLAGLGLGTGGPLAAGALLNTDDQSSRIARAAESLGEFALTDYSPAGLLFSLGDFAFGKPGSRTRALTEALGLKDPKKDDTPATKPQNLQQIAQDTQADAKQKTEDRVAELYEKLGGKGVNKLAALGAGLTAAAAPLLEEDYGAAAAAFQGGLQPEIQRDRDLKDAAAQLAIAEESEERAAQRASEQLEKAADIEMFATGDPNLVLTANRLERAVDELGEAVIALPTKIKNKKATLDVDNLEKNRIYTDLQGIFPQMYVATNSAKQPQAFDNVSQAAIYAQS